VHDAGLVERGRVAQLEAAKDDPGRADERERVDEGERLLARAGGMQPRQLVLEPRDRGRARVRQDQLNGPPADGNGEGRDGDPRM
jgi:hypothetical protein